MKAGDAQCPQLHVFTPSGFEKAIKVATCPECNHVVHLPGFNKSTIYVRLNIIGLFGAQIEIIQGGEILANECLQKGNYYQLKPKRGGKVEVVRK